MHLYGYPHIDIGVKKPGCAARGSETVCRGFVCGTQSKR